MAVGTPKVGALARAGTATSTLAVAYPAGVGAGDLLLIAVPARALNTDAAFTASGWTTIAHQAGTSTRMSFLWRIAAGGETGTVTVSGPAVLRSAKMAAIPGVDTTTPLLAPTVFASAAAADLVTMGSHTPTRPGSLLIWGATGFLGAGTTWQPTKNQVVDATGVTEWLDTWQEVTTGDGRSGAAYFESWPDASATGNRGALPSTAATSAGIFLVAQPPETATTTTTTTVAATTTTTTAAPGEGLPVWPKVRSSAASTHSAAALNVTSETVKRPALVSAGDLLLLYTTLDAGTLADLTPPAGFTQLGELASASGAASVAYKVAGASEPATYTYGRLSASANGASMMVAVRDWDGNTANLRYAQQETSRTARAVPAITPAGRALVLTSAHHDADASAQAWGWIAPGEGLMEGVAHNAAGWSTIGVASHLAAGGQVSGLNWLESTGPSTPATMITTAVSVGAGVATVPVKVGPSSGGSGGALADETGLQWVSGGITHTYHRYAAGLDWTKPVGLLIYTDGSGEFGLSNPTSSYLLQGANGMIAVAKRHNMVLLTPMAPGGGCPDGGGVCWYGTNATDGITPEQKLAWSKALIDKIIGDYDIDRSRIAFGGFSSGAQWTTQFWGPGHAHEHVVDGVAVPIAYGGAPRVANQNTAAFKADVPFVWNVGENDDAWTGTGTARVGGGHDYYSTNGYSTELKVVAGLGHSRYVSVSGGSVGEFGRIVNRAIIENVRPAVAPATTTTTTTTPPATTTTTTEPPATTTTTTVAATTTTTTAAPSAVLFSDDFNRADGALGGSWVTSPAGDITIAGNVAAPLSWDAVALVDIGRSAGYRVSVWINRKEWPGLLFRSSGPGTPDYWAVRSGGMELVRREPAGVVLQGAFADAGGGKTVWAEVREIAAGTEITWGYDATTLGTYVDSKAGRPAGTYVGFLLNGEARADNFVVEDLTQATTTTTTTVPPPPLAMIGDQPVVAAYIGDVPVTSLEALTAAVTTTTTTVAAATTTTTAAATTTTTTAAPGGFLAGDSILYPNYVGDGSVFQRDVSAMPLASNSAAMASYMRQDQVNTGYGTAFNLYQYNFPTYIVRSSQFSQLAHTTWRDMRAWGWTPTEMMGTVFSKGPHNPELNTPAFAPIPEYAVPAVGTDSSMAVYDADTDTLWEWWQIEKIGAYSWHAEWGSRTLNASNKYSGQADVGSVCAAGLMGSLLQIGVGEAQNGLINHALGLVMLAPKRGYSWPARQDDGWVDDVNAPMQGQWFRLDPSLNIDAQSWHPLLKMVCRAVQTYGATCFDKGGAVAWTGESGAYHQAQTGVDPWTAVLNGTPEWQVFNAFPWEQTQWAPIDWGKP